MKNAIHTRRGPLVLLFYDGYEELARPGLSGALYSQGRRVARYLFRNLRRAQVWTGFYAAFRLLRLSLLRSGCDVRVNDFALALRHPTYPIGISGYPSVLEHVSLPNPAIFGPGDYGLPDRARFVAEDPRFRKLIQPSAWAVEFYRPSCGDKMMAMPVGIDTDQWYDSAGMRKDLDVLVYDKIRWHREREVPRVLERVTEHLRRNGRSFEILRYGEHHHSKFASLMRHSRAMLFVCEHETQGIACNEAMSSNVPVLAWDEGVLVDPAFRKFAPPDFRVTSVPYFDARCGERFRIDDFETAFARFWENLGSYCPRQYVLENLSLEKSAQTYLAAYSSLMPAREASDAM